ncbi:hypothetical protein H0H92_011075 [Tricholoma furcatifolium]|nr:hypothetical protein H0H92_011075 [Tricholoma furcatifolium]
MPSPAQPAVVDEESPLLAPQPAITSPIPWAQFSILLSIQLVEPLNTQVISPFAPQLIRDIGITHGKEAQVAYYVGILHSVFYLVQALTVLEWSRISDLVGRRPILLTGLFSVTLSMLCFGFSKTFWALVLSRILYGAMNANVGVVKGTIAELSDGTNLAQMVAYVPIMWATGGTIGPLIGGLLSHPAEHFPSAFGNKFWRTYPYLLPCVVPAFVSTICWITTYVFLRETVKSPVSFHQLSRVWNKNSESAADAASVEQRDNLQHSTPESERPKPIRQLLTRKVRITAINYGLLSLLDIASRTLSPVIYSTPISLGGLGLPPSTIGKVLSATAFLNGFVQLFFFARIHNYFGSKKTFIIGLATSLPVILAFPVMNYVARMHGIGWSLWGVLAFQIIFIPGISFAYGMSLPRYHMQSYPNEPAGAAFILISTASPNRASLGATNGFCQLYEGDRTCASQFLVRLVHRTPVFEWPSGLLSHDLDSRRSTTLFSAAARDW